MGALCFSGFSDVAALSLNPGFLLIMSQRKKSPAREWKLRMPHCPPPRPAPPRPSRSGNSARWDIRPGWPFPVRRQGARSKVE